MALHEAAAENYLDFRYGDSAGGGQTNENSESVTVDEGEQYPFIGAHYTADDNHLTYFGMVGNIKAEDFSGMMACKLDPEEMMGEIESKCDTYLICQIFSAPEFATDEGDYEGWAMYILSESWGGATAEQSHEYTEIGTTPFELNVPITHHLNNFEEIGSPEGGNAGLHDFPLPGWDTPSAMNGLWIGIPFHEAEEDGNDYRVDHRIYEAHILHEFSIEDFYSKKIFADITGRTQDSWGYFNIIQDLMMFELNVPASQINMPPQIADYQYNGLYYIKYAFTIDKFINSKKMIEEFSKLTPYIPYFDNTGQLNFEIIKTEYAQWGGSIIPGQIDHYPIKESEVLDFSFTRTKDVYTKVEMKYNWDYGRNEYASFAYARLETFDSNEMNNAEDFHRIVSFDTGYGHGAAQTWSQGSGYDFNYYGLENDEQHFDSTLKIDAKYIRDEDTAKQFCKWLLYWYCNQHLIMKVKLPLSRGMAMEIGDMIVFESILGGVKPYGIDYSYDAVYDDSIADLIWYGYELNGQQAFPNMMITSTKKTLEYVEIECIQMHLLKLNRILIEGVPGCKWAGMGSDWMTEDGVLWTMPPEYNPDAEFEDNSGSWYSISYACAQIYNGVNFDQNYVRGYLKSIILEPDADLEDNVATVEQIDSKIIPTYNAGGIPYKHDPFQCIGPPSISNPLMYVNNGGNSAIAQQYWRSVDIENNYVYVHLVAEEFAEITAVWIGLPTTYNIYQKPTNIKVTIKGHIDSFTRPNGEIMSPSDVRVFGQDANVGFTIELESVEATWAGVVGFGIEDIPQSNPILSWIDPGVQEEGLHTSSGWLSFDIEWDDWQGIHQTLLADTNTGFQVFNFRIEEGLRGDINDDGLLNVLDIVYLANCVLAQNCPSLATGEMADINLDGWYNVLDIVTLSNAVLAGGFDV